MLILGAFLVFGTLIVWLAINKAKADAAKRAVRLTKARAVAEQRRMASLLHFRYRSAAAEETERKVVDWRLDGENLVGFCLLRQEVRTFKLWRVLEWLSGTDKLLPGKPPPTMPAKRFKGQNRPIVYFSNFPPHDRQIMAEHANAAGLYVEPSFVRSVNYFCTDQPLAATNAAKIQRWGTQVLNFVQFYDFVQDGVLPDVAPAHEEAPAQAGTSALMMNVGIGDP